ncbi:hypothetical protein P3415_003326 [Pseudomonas aeruginosa]|uniref:hypothetical protein n=1 Tax=Pseudomonas TaxID=286 RepID=UPI000A887B74|nr:hypothetical protein [Pseudomonas aeruginosa]EKS2406545.1 hypothetical protein [Pseudomonas aeruginosa]EKW2498586.1 hypothetical protein [Pseudomonas aeruginosa]EKX4040679.1 hypothetical protein [Pseudomonas aeruginosa]ELQ8117636.1 hypothetical protein [Pseudomonas aeruginosa]ELS0721780.1 hypothetical protein [Pseudomonas aeruginosa]
MTDIDAMATRFAEMYMAKLEERGQCIVAKADIERLEAEAQALREEVAALRARVAVVPERKLLNAGVPGLNRNSGWNACLDELARLNGMTVSEGLLRRVCAEQPATCCMDDEMSWRRDRDSALIELRALLNEDKENDDHAA